MLNKQTQQFEGREVTFRDGHVVDYNTVMTALWQSESDYDPTDGGRTSGLPAQVFGHPYADDKCPMCGHCIESSFEQYLQRIEDAEEAAEEADLAHIHAHDYVDHPPPRLELVR